MATSRVTAKAIAEVIFRYVDADTAKKMVRDLMYVEGNKSFTETVEKLRIEVERRSGK